MHIDDADIATDDAYVYIDKELTRASKRAIEMLGEKDIIHVFKPIMSSTSTRLILKKPKTESSVRKIWLPKTVAYILREWHKSQSELKGFLGDEYEDYGLVVALPNGRLCENRIIEKEFLNLKKDAELPNVVFHLLRHTYAAMLFDAGVDVKSAQKFLGHADIEVTLAIYTHLTKFKEDIAITALDEHIQKRQKRDQDATEDPRDK